MKKIIISVICVALVGVLALSLAACSNTSWTALNNAFQNVKETTESIDDVSNEDLASIDSNFSTGSDIIMLSTTFANAEEMTTAGKVAAALSVFDEIKAKTESIENGKATLKTSVANIKTIISELRAAGVHPTEEDKAVIEAYINEIKEIDLALTDTIGKAYKRMHDLRGSYNLANIDTVLTTFNEVNEVLDLRIEKLNRLNEIANEVTALLNSKTIEETVTEE